MTRYILRNTQMMNATAGQWDRDSLAFVGNDSAAGQPPTVTFTGANTLSGISSIGSTTAHGYGAINLRPGIQLTTGGLIVSAANLSIRERPGASMTFNGTSRISAGGMLTATGFGGTGEYIVNGPMNIDGASTVNMDYVAVNGTGTFDLTGKNALLRVGTVGANETVLLDGGMLSLTNGMKFLGTITDPTPAESRIGAISHVNVYNALDAVQETFNRTTGVLDLFNAQGTEVAHLKFAGTGNLYAAPTRGLTTNYIAIAYHPSTGTLPVTFS